MVVFNFLLLLLLWTEWQQDDGVAGSASIIVIVVIVIVFNFLLLLLLSTEWQQDDGVARSASINANKADNGQMLARPLLDLYHQHHHPHQCHLVGSVRELFMHPGTRIAVVSRSAGTQCRWKNAAFNEHT